MSCTAVRLNRDHDLSVHCSAVLGCAGGGSPGLGLVTPTKQILQSHNQFLLIFFWGEIRCFLILRNLLARPWRFNELKKNLEGISQKVLTDSLRSLEEDGIVTRTVYPEVPPRVEYSLNELGESMRPIISAMEQWGLGYQAKVQHGD